MKLKTGKYKLSKEEKNYFISCLLLEKIINHKHSFSLVLFDDDTLLKEYLLDMVNKDLLTVCEESEERKYITTKKGRDLHKSFKLKIIDFRSKYESYSAVDTGEGEIGFESFYDFKTDKEFEDFISEDRFEDLRVAICEYEGINPLEVIFLEMVDEKRFDLEQKSWQFELSSGIVWDELVSITNSLLKLNDLSEEEDEDGKSYTGSEIMGIIIKEVKRVNKELKEYEEESE